MESRVFHSVGVGVVVYGASARSGSSVGPMACLGTRSGDVRGKKGEREKCLPCVSGK